MYTSKACMRAALDDNIGIQKRLVPVVNNQQGKVAYQSNLSHGSVPVGAMCLEATDRGFKLRLASQRLVPILVLEGVWILAWHWG